MNFRREAERARRLRTLAAIAAVVVLAVIAGWLALSRLSSWGQAWQQASLDLRGHEALRSSEPSQPSSPLVLSRRRLALTIDLPVGSEPGEYEVRVVGGSDQHVSAVSGKAELVGGVTVLKLRLDLRRAAQGSASLLVRRTSATWAQYEVFVR